MKLLLMIIILMKIQTKTKATLNKLKFIIKKFNINLF